MASWYLKKTDGSIYGPKDEATLRDWAMDGRIAPDDLLSTDQANWNSVTTLRSLEMEWSLTLDDGEPYGPLHLLAMTEWLLDGSLPFDAEISHDRTGEKARAGAQILPALLALLQQQRERTGQALEQLAASQTAQTELASAGPPQAAEREPPFKETQKWQKLYEDERRHRLEIEGKLSDQVEILRQQLHETQSSRDKLQQKARQLEDAQQKLQDTLEGKGLGDQSPGAALLETYQQLSQNYDAMLNQLAVKSEEASALMEARDDTERSADLRVREMEERLHREREEADSARKRLAELETAHLQLVRSFRDMNDRYIRMKQQMPAAPTAAPITEEPSPEGEASDWKPKVRLT